MPPVSIKTVGQHRLLTLERPDKLNALSYELIDALMGALQAAEDDPAVRCVILTGAGDKAFSAGADIAGFAPDVMDGAEPALRHFVRRGQAMTRRIDTFPKPVIAAVNGLAFGGGCETVEACTLAVAAEHARFAKPEIALGFPPPFGGTQRLPRLIGRKRAMAMLLTGDAVSAQEACAMGLVNRVVPAADLMDHCLALADRIARHAEGAVRATLRAVDRGLPLSMDEALHAEATQFMLAVTSADAREGVQAFLDKRAPVFKGA